VSRLHHSSRAEAVANPAADRPNRVRQVLDLAKRGKRRLQLPSVCHSPSQNAVVPQDGGQVRSQMQGPVGQDKFRQRIGSEDPSVSGSEHQRLAAQVNTSNAGEVCHRNLVKR
jgi:hypothetical protein